MEDITDADCNMRKEFMKILEYNILASIVIYVCRVIHCYGIGMTSLSEDDRSRIGIIDRCQWAANSREKDQWWNVPCD